MHEHIFPNICTHKSSISNNMDYSLTITQEFPSHTFPSHTLAHSPANLNALLFLCLSRCYQPFNDGIISNHWPEEFHYQSWRRYFLLSLKSCGISQLYQEDRKLFTEQRNKRWHGRFENKLYTSWTKKAQNVRWQYKWKFN